MNNLCFREALEGIDLTLSLALLTDPGNSIHLYQFEEGSAGLSTVLDNSQMGWSKVTMILKDSHGLLDTGADVTIITNEALNVRLRSPQIV